MIGKKVLKKLKDFFKASGTAVFTAVFLWYFGTKKFVFRLGLVLTEAAAEYTKISA